MKQWLSRFYQSPDQVRLEQILGATTITIGRFRDKRTNYPFSIVITRGRILRSEKFRRAVLDEQGVLANDVRMAIAIQGQEYERDVVAAYERDEYLRGHTATCKKGCQAHTNYPWTIKYIPRRWLYTQPDQVRLMVKQFI